MNNIFNRHVRSVAMVAVALLSLSLLSPGAVFAGGTLNATLHLKTTVQQTTCVLSSQTSYQVETVALHDIPENRDWSGELHDLHLQLICNPGPGLRDMIYLSVNGGLHLFGWGNSDVSNGYGIDSDNSLGINTYYEDGSGYVDPMNYSNGPYLLLINTSGGNESRINAGGFSGTGYRLYLDTGAGCPLEATVGGCLEMMDKMTGKAKTEIPLGFRAYMRRGEGMFSDIHAGKYKAEFVLTVNYL